MNQELRAPFTWFGGKRRVARQVWEVLGDVDLYVEAFAGSLAVLLGRPHNLRDGRGRSETVNDADGYICNFWRALKNDPDAIVPYCSDPVNETDLFARHLWLIDHKETLIGRLEADPDFFDPKIAGWWVWGQNAWLGSGWCTASDSWVRNAEGPYELRPVKGSPGTGVSRQRQHLGSGRGVLRTPPAGPQSPVGDTLAPDRDHLFPYFRRLAERLRDVQVCAGDWSRVVTTGATSHGDVVGVFLDPPYLKEVRYDERALYSTENYTVAHLVRDWCLENGDNPRYRIVLAGYQAEHDELMPETWRRIHWTGSTAYSSSASAEAGSGNHANRDQEVLWFSPHCLGPKEQLSFMGGLSG